LFGPDCHTTGKAAFSGRLMHFHSTGVAGGNLSMMAAQVGYGPFASSFMAAAGFQLPSLSTLPTTYTDWPQVVSMGADEFLRWKHK